jgi:hypothetical protein
MKYFDTPILFLVFNRPEVTTSVFERIKKIKPKKLFISADGPRKNRENDAKLCNEVRSLFENIDWDCQVYKKFESRNLGCKKGVSSAIDWFFEHVDEGIILEDDCMPDRSFFYFAENLLKKYRNDERIMTICGTNILGKWDRNNKSYFFSFYGSVWGWATWKRAWNKFDFNMTSWTDYNARLAVKNSLASSLQYFFRKKLLDATYRGKIDSWAYGWNFARLVNSGLAIVPSKNLVKNLGFGKLATHSLSSKNYYSGIKLYRMDLPLKHPVIVGPDREFDRKSFNLLTFSYYIITFWYIFREKIFGIKV